MAANFDLDHSNLFNAEDSFSCDVQFSEYSQK